MHEITVVKEVLIDLLTSQTTNTIRMNLNRSMNRILQHLSNHTIMVLMHESPTVANKCNSQCVIWSCSRLIWLSLFWWGIVVICLIGNTASNYEEQYSDNDLFAMHINCDLFAKILFFCEIPLLFGK